MKRPKKRPDEPETAPLAPVRVTYVDAQRFRSFQLAAAASSLPTIVARRLGGVVAAVVAASSLAFAIVLFARSRRSLGLVRVVAGGPTLRFGESTTLPTYSVTRWTLVGGRARLYTPDGGWTLRPVDPTDALAAALARSLGPATPLVRRGSPRAIKIAAAVALGGVALFPVAIVTDSVWMVVPATLCALVGLSTVLALRQRVTSRPSNKARRD
jgi:hypothetical protein